jgi:hypothetical protein
VLEIQGNSMEIADVRANLGAIQARLDALFWVLEDGRSSPDGTPRAQARAEREELADRAGRLRATLADLERKASEDAQREAEEARKAHRAAVLLGGPGTGGGLRRLGGVRLLLAVAVLGKVRRLGGSGTGGALRLLAVAVLGVAGRGAGLALAVPGGSVGLVHRGSLGSCTPLRGRGKLLRGSAN